jgi:retron-type reverse transcriptase
VKHGRWVIEGDLSSYFDTVHHRLLMKAVRRRISDARFMSLLWKTIKAGHVDVGLFRAASEGVPQGGVISPLLSNIMLNEFDQYLHERYLSGKARKDRWYWNHSIQGAEVLRSEKTGNGNPRWRLPVCR